MSDKHLTALFLFLFGLCVIIYFIVTWKPLEPIIYQPKIKISADKTTHKQDFRKEIVINTYILWNTVISFIVVFITNHFGEFMYKTGQTTSNYDGTYSTKISSLSYISPLGSKVTDNNPSYTYVELISGDFNYFSRIPFYISSTFKDAGFIILISGILSLLIFLTRRYRIKIT